MNATIIVPRIQILLVRYSCQTDIRKKGTDNVPYMYIWHLSIRLSDFKIKPCTYLSKTNWIFLVNFHDQRNKFIIFCFSFFSLLTGFRLVFGTAHNYCRPTGI